MKKEWHRCVYITGCSEPRNWRNHPAAEGVKVGEAGPIYQVESAVTCLASRCAPPGREAVVSGLGAARPWGRAT